MGRNNSRLGRLAARLPAVLWIAMLCLTQLAAAPLQPGGEADLVRVTAGPEDNPSTPAALKLPVYARLETPGGGFILIARADRNQQAALVKEGFDVRRLAGVAAGSDLFVLYGLPEQIQIASRQVRLLAASGRQAVVVATGEQIETLERNGIGALYLTPQIPSAVQLQPLAAAPPALAPSITYSPVVQQMVNDIHQSTLYNYVSLLSGEQPALIGGAPYSLVTRFTLNLQAINKATLFGYEHFAGLGLPVDFDYYNFNYGGSSYQRRNVVAQQTGLTQPNRIFLLTGHLDSYSGFSNSYNSAPGADDNASGSAAVLAIADVLSRYHLACTVRYVLFTGEELGLFGSYAYAADVDALNENIEGVLNLDMLGYNTIGTGRQIELHTRPGNSGDLYIANLFSQAVGAYSQNLAPVILQDSLSFSDHKPFWDRGFPAILAIEDWADHTPQYHTVNDRISTFDMSYYTAFVKAAMATFAHMGCLLDGAITGTVTGSGGAPLANASVSITPAGGSPQYLTTAGNGSFWSQLIAGSYSTRFSAENHRSLTINNVHVAGYQAATLNPALQPCSTIKNLSSAPGLILGEAGVPLNFQAQVGAGEAPVGYAWFFGDGGNANGAQVQHTYAAAGVYPFTLWANNSCDFPVFTGGVALIGVEPIFLPLVSN